jgi:hypothetical protein
MKPVTLNTGFLQADYDALMARFAPGAPPFFEAITIRLVFQQFSGIVLLYTSAPFSFTVPACDGTGLTQYIHNDVGIEKGSLKMKATSGQSGNGSDPTVSIQIDEQTLTMTPDMNSAAVSVIGPTGPNVPFLKAIRQRAFDAAVIQRDRWFFDPDLRTAQGLPTAVGGIQMFYGYAAAIDQLGRTQIGFKVKAALALLGIQMPRNLYQPNCLYTVYSTSCGAVKATFVQHGTVTGSPTASTIPWLSGVPGSIPFAGGEITMQTGPAINQTRTIRAFDSTNLYLTYPFTIAPLSGDTFAAFPGCNRADPLAAGSTSDCIYFSRQGSYKAFPRTPQNELGL